MEGNLEALDILEDGMYVRTNEGIDKFEYKYKHNEYDFYIYEFQKRSMSNPEYYIIGKPSFSPIELLEVGDYVNKHRVSNVFDEYITTEDDQITIDKENIKSIVTKEQFESMEYKVGE